MRLSILFILLFCSYCVLFAQPQSPSKKAEAFFRNGFSEFEANHYDLALTEFRKVFNLTETRFHDPAYFYAGLCYYNDKDYDLAIQCFQKNIDKEPESRYKEEAIYHKGLSMLNKPSVESREGGLFVLMDLENKTVDNSLKQDIRNTILNFLYNSRIFFLENYYQKVRTSYKSMVAEALAYQYHLEKQKDKLIQFIDNYQKELPLTHNLVKIKNLATYNSFNNVERWKDTLKIAVVLPLNALEYTDSSQNIKLINRYALEFLYGLEYGLENKTFPNIQKIKIKVFDSQRDSNVVKQLTKKELVDFQPQIIIGEFVTSNSQILSQYCESHQILQIIPFANAELLVNNKSYTFLLNSTLSNQTAVIAKWIAKKSDFKNIVGIFDDTPEGKKTAEIFAKGLEKLKFKILYFETSNWQNSVNQIIEACLDTLHLVDAVFMNIQKQEHFELLLNRLTRSDTTQFTLITVNDIKNFSRIDGKRWYYFSTVFTQLSDINSKFEDKEKIQNIAFNQYKLKPTVNFYQGMDVVEILSLVLTEKYKGKTWKESFESLKAFQGYNQNYFFGQSNSNQSIKLYQFQKNGVNQLEIW